MNDDAAGQGPHERPVGRRVTKGTQASKEWPILFSAPMVRALLDGSKTQTRRVVQGAPDDWAPIGPEVYSPTVVDRNGDEQPGPDAYGSGNDDGSDWIRCPYGQPGDRLWVREAFRLCAEADSTPPRDTDAAYRMWYEADAPHQPGAGKLRPSMFMPRWACRITLVVTGVRVERLQDISRGDAMAEGCPFPNMARGEDPRVWYEDLWCDLNGADSWRANPWVWVVEFRKTPNAKLCGPGREEVR